MLHMLLDWSSVCLSSVEFSTEATMLHHCSAFVTCAKLWLCGVWLCGCACCTAGLMLDSGSGSIAAIAATGQFRLRVYETINLLGLGALL